MQGDWKLDAYLLYLLILLADKLIGFCLLAYYSGSNSIVSDLLPLQTPFLSPLYDCDLFNSSCLGLLAWGSWSRSSLHHPNIELQTRVCLSMLSSPSGTG